MAIPQGVEVYSERVKPVGGSGPEFPRKHYGLSYYGKVVVEGPESATANELFDLEFQPGTYYARVNFSVSHNLDRIKLINTAGIIAREIVLRYALLVEYNQTNDAVLEKLRQYKIRAADRTRDETGKPGDYLTLAVPPLNIDKSVDAYETMARVAWEELGNIVGEVKSLIQQAETLGVTHVWDPAIAPLSLATLFEHLK